MSEKEGSDDPNGFGPPIDAVAFRTAPPPPAQNYVAPPPPSTHRYEDIAFDDSRSRGDESSRGRPSKPAGTPSSSPDPESRNVTSEGGSNSSTDVSCRRLNSGGSTSSHVGGTSNNNDSSFRRLNSGGSSNSASGNVGISGDSSCKRMGSGGNSSSGSHSSGDSSFRRMGSGDGNVNSSSGDNSFKRMGSGGNGSNSGSHSSGDSSFKRLGSGDSSTNSQSNGGDSSCKRMGSGSSSSSVSGSHNSGGDRSCRRVNSNSSVSNLNIPIPLTPVSSPSTTPTFISTTPSGSVHTDWNTATSTAHVHHYHSNVSDNPHTPSKSSTAAAPPPPLTPTTPTAPMNIFTTTPNHRRSPTPIHVLNATELRSSALSTPNNETAPSIETLFFEEDFAGMGRLKRPSWQPPPKPPGFPSNPEAENASVVPGVAQNEQQQQQASQEHSVKNVDAKSSIPPPPASPPPPVHAPREKRQSIIERLLGTAEKKVPERPDTLLLPKSLPTDKLSVSGKLEVESTEDPPIDDGVLSFVHFPHIFDSILAQVNGGLHVVKRTVSYLKKLVSIQEQFVVECEKVNHLELSKQDTLKKEDQMLGFLELAVSVRGNMESMIKRHKHFGIQLSAGVIRPLEVFIKDSDASCTKLVQGYERAALTVAQHTAEMEKQRQVCLKEWDELADAVLTEKAKPQGVAKKKVQTKKAFTRFEELKALAMPARYQFVHVTRPHLLRKFEALEIARMEILQTAMTEFAKAQAAFWGTEVSLPQLDSGSLSAAAVLADTMARWLRQHGSAPATQLSPSQLPCSPEALDSESWREFLILPQPGEEDEEEEEVAPSQGRAATGFASMLRGVVSKKKKRFQEGGFDLDLSYITPRIIAMGFPAESITGLYRNNMVDVQKFMTTRHPGNVHVYNLCAEMSYDPQKFEGQVSCFPFFDHNPCPLNMILPFCLHVHDWLLKDPSHVVAVHCKAGKGRTGFMIACYLLYSGLCGSAAEALEFYALKRTKDSKGVTIPSQIRYVSYFEQLLGSIGWLERPHPPLPVRNVLFLKSVTLRGIPYAYSASPEQLSFVVVDPNKKHEDGTYRTVFSSKGVLQPHADLAQDCILFSADTAPCIVELCDDFKVVFSGSSKLFSLWANTRVVHEVVPLSFHPPYRPPVGVHSSDDPFRVAPKDSRPVKIIVCPSCGHERPLEVVGDDGRPVTADEDASELCHACKSALIESDASCSRNNNVDTEEPDDLSSTNNSDQRGKAVEDKARLEKSKDWKEVATQLKREAEQAAKVQLAYRLVMGKQDLDKAVKDKKHLLFPAYMTVELLFHEVHRLDSDAKANSSLPSLSTSPHPLPTLTPLSPAACVSSTTRLGRAQSSSSSTASSFLSHMRTSSLSVTSPSSSKSSLFSPSPKVASNSVASPTASITSFSAPSKSEDFLS